MIERTLVLVKPDGVQRALIGKVISRLEDAGLKAIAMKMIKPDEKLVGSHYVADQKWLEDTGNKTINSYKERGMEVKETAVEAATRIRSYLIGSLTGKPVVAIVFEGNEATYVTRKIVGSTEPKRADPSTIRGSLSTDSYDMADVRKEPIKNIVHASEDGKTAEREIGIWFKPDEILKYSRIDEKTLY